MISDDFLRPSSCRRGRWEESGCETTCYVLQKNGKMYVANNSSILQYCHGMSIEGLLVFYRTTVYANSWEGGGGLYCEAKAQVLVVTPPPPPPSFPESRSQKGGRNSGAVWYLCISLVEASNAAYTTSTMSSRRYVLARLYTPLE